MVEKPGVLNGWNTLGFLPDVEYLLIGRVLLDGFDAKAEIFLAVMERIRITRDGTWV